MARRINAPGTEINEIDRSSYDNKEDYSIVGTTSLICGFADKGEDYVPQWINSEKTLVDYYGYPTNEAERYFYNAGMEILNKGGLLVMSKLPYDNSSKDCFCYVDYKVDLNNLRTLSTINPEIVDQDLDNPESNKLLTEINETTFETDYQLSALAKIDQSLSSFVAIYQLSSYELMHMNDHNKGIRGGCTLDQLKTNTASMPVNTFRIVDMTRSKYGKINIVTDNGKTIKSKECLGIMPVVVTPTVAMYYQNMLRNIDGLDKSAYNVVNNVFSYVDNNGVYELSPIDDDKKCYATALSSDNTNDQTLSKMAASRFPLIDKLSYNTIDREHLKKIGIVVFKAYKDYGDSNMIAFTPVESFVGSFDKGAKDPDTNASLFIDNIVNSKSKFINLFSNVQTNSNNYKNATTLHMSNQSPVVMGFIERQCAKTISFKESIMSSLDNVFEQCKDPNIVPIDIVVDAGMSTIAAWCKALADEHNDPDEASLYDPTSLNQIFFDACEPGKGDNSALQGWRATLLKYDNFAKSTRKDCIFLADAIRSFCLMGNSQIVRKTLPLSSVKNQIIPRIESLVALNSNYSAGYCNWYLVEDVYSKDMFWCPPSIKAAGVFTYIDAYFHPWDAPAGITRATLNDVIDCAFSPNIDDSGQIYNNCWNYAVNYPLDGVVIEGQKTFQKRKTAFDRINVRRLFLSIEKQIKSIAKYYVYEGNTEYLRQRFVDAVSEVLDNAAAGDGIAEYAIRCDETNNTQYEIENNELHCSIAIRPVKSIEFIVLNFIATSQSADVVEQLID